MFDLEFQIKLHFANMYSAAFNRILLLEQRTWLNCTNLVNKAQMPEIMH